MIISFNIVIADNASNENKNNKILIKNGLTFVGTGGKIHTWVTYKPMGIGVYPCGQKWVKKSVP